MELCKITYDGAGQAKACDEYVFPYDPKSFLSQGKDCLLSNSQPHTPSPSMLKRYILTHVEFAVAFATSCTSNATVQPQTELQVGVAHAVQHGRTGARRVVHHPIRHVSGRPFDQIELGQLHVVGDGDGRATTVPPIQHIVRGVADWKGRVEQDAGKAEPEKGKEARKREINTLVTRKSPVGPDGRDRVELSADVSAATM